VAVSPKLKAAIVKKLGVSDRHVDRLITSQANTLMLPREQAAVAVALDNNVNITRLASPEDLAAVRHARGGSATAPLPTAPQPATSSAPRARPSKGRATAGAARKPSKKVFVVHGRDEPRKRAMFAFLRAIGLSPMDFRAAIRPTGKAAPYVGEVLEAAFKEAAAVVVLLTADDEARLLPPFQRASDPPYEKRLTGQARPNVLFESGLAFGYHPDRTLLVQVGEMRPFSDVAGRHVIHLDNSAEARSDVASRLAAAGCDVDIKSSADWYSEGDFSS